ncbi:serine/threonine-protein kinase [Roseateles koreensis]|uniref:Protein kinase domain-containing protein n=1 Tax=Roseateles koreensis TaxID=2987526 RepID=A0ABT5KPY0_9BURK|nr:hypothetical protein [Roseateles koreensis]MDC8784974.1 hypothetical protein [Roseateles koreensis]
MSEGLALGVWRVRSALESGGVAPWGSSGQPAQWYGVSHALAKDQTAVASILPRDERSIAVMLRFGDLAAEFEQLSHPALAPPTDSGVTPTGQPYLIFERGQGRPLLQAAAALPLRERLALLLQFCEALRAAHQQGWLWAEIDPSMVWLGHDHQVRLMALGLMRMAEPSSPFEHVMALSSAAGYASPEILAGEVPNLGSEVFGVGALLRALVMGEAMAGVAGSGDVEPALSPKAQFSLDALIHKALAPQPEFRYASVDDFSNDLKAWLAGQDHSALSFKPMPELREPLAVAIESTVSPWSPARSGGRWLAALVLLGVLMAGAWVARDVLRVQWQHFAAKGPDSELAALRPSVAAALPSDPQPVSLQQQQQPGKPVDLTDAPPEPARDTATLVPTGHGDTRPALKSMGKAAVKTQGYGIKPDLSAASGVVPGEGGTFDPNAESPLSAAAQEAPPVASGALRP